MGQHILLCANTSWGILNFRKGLITELIARGDNVTVVAPFDDASEALTLLGCEFIDVQISAKGMNPFEDLLFMATLTKIYRKLKPDCIIHYTIKPNIYGSLASRIARIPSIAVTTGLGYSFDNPGFVARIAKVLYKIAFVSPIQVWFLNQEDMNAFVEANLVKAERARLLDSEGVDTDHFSPRNIPVADESIRFLLVARMLWDKGIGEFVEAAGKIQTTYPNSIFQLLGDAEANNPRNIGREKIAEWERGGTIQYLGTVDDVRPIIASADCIVLPSYREGVPRTLLEAASMGKPVITTDTVGCRETVVDDVTGLLCEAKSAESLASAMEKILLASEEHRADMGQAGRDYIIRRFDEKKIIDTYLEVLEICR